MWRSSSVMKMKGVSVPWKLVVGEVVRIGTSAGISLSADNSIIRPVESADLIGAHPFDCNPNFDLIGIHAMAQIQPHQAPSNAL